MLHLPGRLQPEPCSHIRPLLPHASTGDTQALKGRSGSVSCGGHCSFPWALACTRFCLHPPSISVVLEKTLESPLDCKEIQPIHPKGNQS